jgi:hypothetical protein
MDVCKYNATKDTTFEYTSNIVRNCVHRNHIILQLKLKKQLIYNCYATIPWVLQLLYNYPLKNMVY